MATFMATFGVQYATEPHPTGKYADPDGYVLIHADDYDHAVSLMQAAYGINYAFIYDEDHFDPSYHLAGVVAELGEVSPPVEEGDGYCSAPSFVKARPENNQHYLDQMKDHPWWPIISACAEALEAIVPGYNIAQIKEKFGGLRFYVDQGNCPDEVWMANDKQVDAIIMRAEEQAAEVDPRNL